MKRLILLLAVLGLSVTGCSKATKSDSGNPDEVAQADTAKADTPSGDSVESLPAIDETKPADAAATPPAAPEAAAAPATPPAPPAAAEATPPTPAETPSAPATGTGQTEDYTIQKGDTLMKIAFNIYGDISQWKALYELNKEIVKSANHLKPGAKLKFDKPASEPAIEKNGDPYLIKKGDTLGTIADDIYAKRSKWKKLYENNKTLIKDPNKIYAGFYLYYQITEQEKQEAEAIKARRGGGGQKVGDTSKLPDSASNTAPAQPAAGGGLGGMAAMKDTAANGAPTTAPATTAPAAGAADANGTRDPAGAAPTTTK